MYRVITCYFHIQGIFKLCIFVETELDFLFHFPQKVRSRPMQICVYPRGFMT